MYTIFIEYKIYPHAKKGFLLDLKSVHEQLKNEEVQEYQILEAVDQPDLFVEMMKVADLDIYHNWKQLLSTEDLTLPWAPLMKHIVGGRKKFHMWSFRPIPLSSFKGERNNERA